MALSPDIMKTYGRIDIAFTHGKGSFLFSDDGGKYLDYATGIAVNAFGHSHPELINALKDQASKLWHVSNLYKIPEQDRVASLLVKYSCTAFVCHDCVVLLVAHFFKKLFMFDFCSIFKQYELV